MSFIHDCKLSSHKELEVSALKNVVLVSYDNWRAKRELMSREAIRIERKRQFEHPQFIIHPYSNFRIVWDFIIAITIYYLILLESLFLTFEQSPYKANNKQYGVYMLYPMNVITILDIIVNFYTGFYDSNTQRVEFDRRRVAVNYLKGKFAIHVLFAIPWYAVVLVLQFIYNNDMYRISGLFTIASIVRTLRMSDVFKFLGEFEHRSYSHKTLWQLIRLWVVTSVLYHFGTCLQMNLYVVFKGQYFQMTFVNQTWIIVENFGDLYSAHMWGQYFKSMFRAASAITLYGLGISSDETAEEKCLNMLLRTVGVIFRMYLVRIFVVVLRPGFTRRNYHYVSMAFEDFARHRDLPRDLKVKIQTFLNYHYSFNYYEESRVLGMFSAPLKREVLDHCYRQLISRPRFFRTLTEDVMSDLISSLRSEVYLTGEFLEKSKESGLGMWFVCSGTVSVISHEGVVLFKLEDDDFFGGKCLFYESVDCDCSIVAEEITELKLLKKQMFWKVMENRQDLFHDMMKIFNEECGGSSRSVSYTVRQASEN
ncbi:potassium/sodium hyperpolarization-activated cyclic nucleotide-gated channel 4-like [Arctopsyche grandis]|uniref:potassium/sodium hyperpolarization-activated cyclic nucleotide-gated channel 4-like n=1 Tax=Arctopsyche grandis TaxID=121162 RepID=UPI00406D974B